MGKFTFQRPAQIIIAISLKLVNAINLLIPSKNYMTRRVRSWVRTDRLQ